MNTTLPQPFSPRTLTKLLVTALIVLALVAGYYHYRLQVLDSEARIQIQQESPL